MTAAAPSNPAGYSPGLEGVIAGETAIASIEDGLRYRGYPVGELVANCSYDEVALLLLYGELPKQKDLDDYRKRLAGHRKLPGALSDLLKAMPKQTPGMDAIRSAVSVMAHFDPDVNDNGTEANIRKTERLLAQIPLAIVDQYRLARGEKLVAPRTDLTGTANFMYMLRGKEASPDEVRALDLSLILYAEHDFNASTFTARVIASTESDLHSAIVGAIGALKGPLHGGANERVVDLLKQAGSPEKAKAWIDEALKKKVRIMGFGHRVYKSGDVRAGILKPYTKKIAAAAGYENLEKIADVIEEVMAAEKKLYPNVDWPAGRLYHALGLEPPIYTPMFVMSRVAGQAAHLIEQYKHNRLIRPRSLYNGPGLRSVTPIAQR
jgi:2-methylcitrate synthase/citrate synthase II